MGYLLKELLYGFTQEEIFDRKIQKKIREINDKPLDFYRDWRGFQARGSESAGNVPKITISMRLYRIFTALSFIPENGMIYKSVPNPCALAYNFGTGFCSFSG
jgi:hypothetical protein